MRKPDRIHFDKLLGFELLARELSKALDFQDESFGAKLGAKVGTESGPSKTIEFAKLLGFESIAEGLPKVVDFTDETLSDKLGAKIGEPEV